MEVIFHHHLLRTEETQLNRLFVCVCVCAPRTVLYTNHSPQMQDEDATGDDISEIPDMDSPQSDAVSHTSSERTATQGKGTRPTLSSQNSNDLDSPTDTLLQQDIPPGKLPPAIEAVLRGAWPFEKALWHSSPASMGMPYKNNNQVETELTSSIY